MDALYIYKHSEHDDFEIRHSLRSIELHAPYFRKIWIYGDRPKFLSDDTSLIEHVPHSATAAIVGAKTPVANYFLLIFLSSLIPDLFFEYVLFSDDFFLLKDCPDDFARKIRYLEDLSLNPVRRPGIFRDALWRTYDELIRLGYTGYNFETHTPTYLTRKWVTSAYRDLKDFISEDRWIGLLGPTGILNHVYKKEKIELTDLMQENSRCGFWGTPPTYEEVIEQSDGKIFFNFDDPAFGPAIERFLRERFPNRSKFEKE
ncbi:MAG: hypothetical protein ABSF29_06435 [Tepidisphaeraceae bacterium]|jgi:hypothetical protein